MLQWIIRCTIQPPFYSVFFSLPFLPRPELNNFRSRNTPLREERIVRTIRESIPRRADPRLFKHPFTKSIPLPLQRTNNEKPRKLFRDDGLPLLVLETRTNNVYYMRISIRVTDPRTAGSIAFSIYT